MNSAIQNALRAAYQKLPFDGYYKYQIISILFRYFPLFFKWLPEYQRWKALAVASARPWDVTAGITG